MLCCVIVAKSTSMYGDPAQDIQILTDDIKSSMTQLHKRLKDLEALRDSGQGASERRRAAEKQRAVQP